jgi:hypothetical protein
MKDAYSQYYFNFCLCYTYITTNIYSFKTVACSTKFNGFTPGKVEQQIHKGLMEIPSKEKVVEKGHRICEVTGQNKIRFSIFS